MYLVSVIIPVYNIRSLIETCVDSVIRQSYSRIEIILVDDGSTDGSAGICDSLAAKDCRIKVFHKQNGGLSDARNFGLLHATGDYIFYLDGDDRISEYAIGALVEAAKAERAGIVQGGFFYEYDDFMMTLKECPAKKVFGRDEAMLELVGDGLIKNFAWGSLIKRELALKVPFIKGRYFEDSFWKYRIIDLSSGVVYIGRPMYYYRQRNGSISSVFSMKNMHLLEGNGERLEFVRKNYPLVFRTALKEHWRMAFYFMKLAAGCNKETGKAFREYFERLNVEYRHELQHSLNRSCDTRILFLISEKFGFMYPLYDIIRRILSRFQPDRFVRISTVKIAD